MSSSTFPASRIRASVLEPVVQTAESRPLSMGPYQVRMANTESDRMAAYALRFNVFNVELNAGLADSAATRMDFDRYDAVCDHLIVEHAEMGRVVGTYRLQTGEIAAKNFGYYSEQEFDFSPYEKLRSRVVELGRACIDAEHRSTEVLHLLWRGIAQYALQRNIRYMIGCSSLSSQDAVEGLAVYRALAKYIVAGDLRTRPLPEFSLPQEPLLQSEIIVAEVPKLLRTYLTIGAKICGEPAIDREFKTIDFLTLLDLEELHPRIAARFLEGL
jgi:putative hemolysin